MEYMNRYMIRPATGGRFAIYKVVGENRAEKFYTGTKEECSEGYINLAAFYGDLCRYCRDNFVLEKGKATYAVVIAMSHTEGVNPTMYQTELDLDVDEESFFDLIMSDMREAGYNPANPETKVDHIVYIGYKHGLGEDCHGRHPFVPTEGLEYENAGGGMYKCLFNGKGYSLMSSVASSWTFKAYDIVIDDKGQIEWSHSECGRFEKPGGISRFQKQLIYEELRMEYLMEDIFNVIKEKITLIEKYGQDKRYRNALESLTRDDVEDIATEFLEDHDRMIADYDQIIALIDNYVRLQKGGWAV